MLENIEVLCHSSIRINKDKVIYIDPFRISKNYNDADYIFITHDHYDHFSPEDINKVRKNNSIIIVPENLYNKTIDIGFKDNYIVQVIPNSKYVLNEISFETVPAYNINKPYHLKDFKWVGYILNISDTLYYIAGDTDVTDENKLVKCDVAFVPVGGKYTMDFKEAASLVNMINPNIAIPIHYGTIVGNVTDAESFKKLLNSNIEVKILIR